MGAAKLIAGLPVFANTKMLLAVVPLRDATSSGFPSPFKSPHDICPVGAFIPRTGRLVLSNFAKAKFPGVLWFCNMIRSVAEFSYLVPIRSGLLSLFKSHEQISNTALKLVNESGAASLVGSKPSPLYDGINLRSDLAE